MQVTLRTTTYTLYGILIEASLNQDPATQVSSKEVAPQRLSEKPFEGFCNCRSDTGRFRVYGKVPHSVGILAFQYANVIQGFTMNSRNHSAEA